MNLKMRTIRKITGHNVRKQLKRCIRKSTEGKVTIACCTKPKVNVPAWLEVMDIVEKGAKVIAATVRGGMMGNEIGTDDGNMPLSIIGGNITMCWQENAA